MLLYVLYRLHARIVYIVVLRCDIIFEVYILFRSSRRVFSIFLSKLFNVNISLLDCFLLCDLKSKKYKTVTVILIFFLTY